MELENPVFMDISVMEKKYLQEVFAFFDSKEVNIFPEIAAGGRLEGIADRNGCNGKAAQMSSMDICL